jgi:hypothetical protein
MENSNNFHVGDTVIFNGRIGLVYQVLNRSRVCPVVVKFLSGAFTNLSQDNTLRFTKDGVLQGDLPVAKLQRATCPMGLQ